MALVAWDEKSILNTKLAEKLDFAVYHFECSALHSQN